MAHTATYVCANHLSLPISIIQNEKRKDKEVTARIERILKLRDQAMKGVDMGACKMFIFTHTR
jgi:hypothetical protein